MRIVRSTVEAVWPLRSMALQMVADLVAGIEVVRREIERQHRGIITYNADVFFLATW